MSPETIDLWLFMQKKRTCKFAWYASEINVLLDEVYQDKWVFLDQLQIWSHMKKNMVVKKIKLMI